MIGPDDIEVLSGLEAVRRRPEMYLGRLDSPNSLLLMLEQVMCASLDETMTGRCSRIDVRLHDDGGVTVEDDGPGMSVEVDRSGMSYVEIMMTQLHACRAARENPAVAKKYCGAGIAVTNALSDECMVEVRRGGRAWVQRYREGVALARLADIGSAVSTGNRIRFRPDPKLFRIRFEAAAMQQRLDEISAEMALPKTALTLTPG
jgi:DNA gyrase subunit B